MLKQNTNIISNSLNTHPKIKVSLRSLRTRNIRKSFDHAAYSFPKI